MSYLGVFTAESMPYRADLGAAYGRPSMKPYEIKNGVELSRDGRYTIDSTLS